MRSHARRAGATARRGLDLADAGICLDFGHAHLMGDVARSRRNVSGPSVTTHVHDNRGRTRRPSRAVRGIIDWPATLMAMRKIGYDGTLIFEVAAHGAADGDAGAGARARAATDSATGRTCDCARTDSSDAVDERPMHVYIEDIAQARRPGRSRSKAGCTTGARAGRSLPAGPRRHGFIQAVMSKAAVGEEMFPGADHSSQETALIVTGIVRADTRAPGGYEIDVDRPRGRRARRTTTRSRQRNTASTS